MPENCVRPLGELSLEQLLEDIDQALDHWSLPATDTSPIGYLRLFRNLQRDKSYAVDQATATILDEGVAILQQQPEIGRKVGGKVLAQLLTDHYKHHVTQAVLCKKYNILEAGLNKRLREAKKRLAAVVYALENKARLDHRSAQLGRLEAPTYQTLIGASIIQRDLKKLLSQPGPPFLIALQGLGGRGKTAHADKLLRDIVAEDIFDEIAWVSAKQEKLTISGSLRELGQPTLTQEALVERLVEQFLPTQEKPESFSYGEALAMLEGRLKECPCCIGIDNIETAADIDALLPTLQRLVDPSKIILTTRERIKSDDIQIAPVELPELDEQDALLLIRGSARENHLTRVREIDDQDLRLVYNVVGGNPLALRIITGQLQFLGLRQVLEDLKGASGIPNENLFKYIYLHAWERLDPSARSVLVAMLLLCPQGGEYALLLHITQMDRRVLRKALDILIDLSLVQTRGSGNETIFSIHNLTRTFLHEEVLRPVVNLSPTDQSQIAEFGHFIHQATDFIFKEIQYAGTILREDEREQALHVLSYALKLASRDTNAWPGTRDLLLGLAPKLELAGFHADWLPCVKQGIAVSKTNLDRESEALLQAHLGLLCRVMGDYDAAHDALAMGASYFEKSGDTGQLAAVLTQRAHIDCIQRRHPEARAFIQQALVLLAEADPQREYVHYVQGLLALNENDPVAAEQWFKKSLQFCEQQADKRLIAKRLGNLGTALYAQRQLEQALAYYERSIALFEEVQDDVQRAMMEMGVGNIYLLREQPHKSLEEYAKAEPSLRMAHEALHLAMLDVNWGIAKRQLGEWQEAEERLFTAIARLQQLRDFHREANARYELGLLYYEQQFIEKAKQAFREALACLAKSEPNLGQDALQQKLAACLEQLETTGNTTATPYLEASDKEASR